MRTLTVLLLVGLAAGAGLGAAQSATTVTATNDHPCAAEGRNATTLQWRAHCAQNMTTFLRASIEQFNENRSLLLAQHEANESHVRATFADGKLAALQDCLAQAAPFGRNASGPHSGVLAACLKEKMAPLRDAAKASHQAERQSLGDALQAARETAKARFAAQRDAWLAANPKP